MAQNANLFKTNFSSGEISPSMGGRLDVTRHKNGAAEVNNFVVRPQGPLVRRMGTRFLGEVSDSSKKTEIIPFQFSTTQTYLLEFGDFTLRIWKNRELLESGGIPIEIATVYPESAVKQLYYAQSADVMYIAHPLFPPQKVSRISDTNWTIEDAPFEDGPYRITRQEDRNTTLWLTNFLHRATITSTLSEFVVGDVGKFVEFWKDGLLIIGEIKTFISGTQVTIEPKENVVDIGSLDTKAVINYNSADTKVVSSLAIWSSETEYSYVKVENEWRYITTHDPIPRQVGTPPNAYSADCMNLDNGLKPTMKLTSGKLLFSNETITATLRASQDFFTDVQDIGRHFRMDLGGRIVWGWVTSFTNTKQASVRLGVRIPADPRNGQVFKNDATTTEWRYGAWFKDNYPSCVTFHQGRLVFAGTSLEPNRGWMSESDDFVSFATTNIFAEVLDSSGINFGIASGEVNTILWLQSGPVLLIGTIGEEFQIKPTSLGEALTPTNMNVTGQTSYGSKEGIRPIKIGPSTLFVQQHGQRTRELVYSFEIDSFTAADTTIVSEHIFREHTSAVSMCYQQIPNSLLWFVCEDGKLVSLTFEKEQQVYAWSNHSLGGDGFVESIATIPSTESKQDELYMVVRRTIDGVTKRYLEVMVPDFYPENPQDKTNMVYLDCSLTYEGTPITTMTGLDHLEGEEISLLVNGAVHPNRTVISGQVDLQLSATSVIAGYSYVSHVRTLPEEGGSPTGTSHGKLKKIVRVDIQLLDSIGLKFGRTMDSAKYPKSFRETQGNMGQSPDLFTGFLELTDDSGFNKDGQFYILQDQPYPLNILALMPIVKVNE